MQKRYQVFVSSTFVDLQDERAEVMQALLELDCIPAGMELFPAANDEQWEWIKKVIDDSDYYMVIVAGRYGQTHPTTGKSFTEMEYQYAVDAGKPIVAFIHEDTNSIPLSKSEKNKKNQRKLVEFTELCKKRLCKFWATPSDLGAKVSRSITQLIRHNPAPGWIKATMVDEAGLLDLEGVRLENKRLKQQISSLKGQSSLREDMTVLEDSVTKLEWEILKKQAGTDKNGRKIWKKLPLSIFRAEVTWKEIIQAIFPHLISETIEFSGIRYSLSRMGDKYALKEVGDDEKLDACYSTDETVSPVRNKLLSLGLIEISGAGSHSESWRLVQGAKETLLKFIAD